MWYDVIFFVTFKTTIVLKVRLDFNLKFKFN